MRLVIAGGGTGGHIFAGVAIAQEFAGQSRANEVLFIGSANGLETRLVPRSGFRLETLALGKLVGQRFAKRLITLWQIPWATLRSLRLLRRFKADFVVGVGGYAAGPCVLAARLLGIPIGVLEQNSVMGLTNRIAAGLAQHVFLAFPGVPRGAATRKCVVTGNPARSNLKPSAAKSAKPFVVFAFGGSQGAAGINRLMLEAARELLPLRGEIRVIHQTGPNEHARVAEAYREIGFPAEVHAFIEDMQSMYDKASLVVSRAGSGTLSELAATGNAAILVPFPAAAGNHQEANARAAEQASAAIVFIERGAKGADLARLITRLRQNPAELGALRANMAGLHRPDAARRIVDIMKARVLCASG